MEKQVIIVGGGLAGLTTANHLARAGIKCHLFEKRTYPFRRVCGEYISNEVVPYLRSLDLFPEKLGPSNIKWFQLTSVNGRAAQMPLDLGGFGISRYRLDEFLYQRGLENGVEFHLDQEVTSIAFNGDRFEVHADTVYTADVVIGSFGKRSKLDVQLGRSFIQKRSPYVGVKYHIRYDSHPPDLISLHNFKDGYCGISHVENNIVNLCYLTHRENVKARKNIRAMEEAVLFQNPFLKKIFENAQFLFEKPETINEISFETKAPVEQHILMLGDAARMITPLCGNGMAMAIHSAKILSEHVIRFCQDKNYSRLQLEQDYAKAWRSLFASRLWAGRQIQRLFGDVWTSNLAVNLARHVRPVADFLMRKTHGTPF